MPTDANGKYFEVGCLTPQQYYAWDDKPEEFVFEPLTDNAKACVEVHEAKQTSDQFEQKLKGENSRNDMRDNSPKFLFPICQKDNQTEIENARRFTDDHGGKARYVHAWKKWVVFTGNRWQIDNAGYVKGLAKQTVRDIIDEAIESENQTAINFALKSATSRGINALLSLAEPDLAIDHTEFDTDPFLLNCENGTIDLRTGELRPHKQSDFLTKLCPTPYNPDAETYEWDRFVESLFDHQDEIDHLKRFTGYCLTGDVREQVLPIPHGDGANGKTTYWDSVTNTMGPDYAMSAPAEMLMESRSDRHPTEKADLFGKRLVIASETEANRTLAESMVKQLTGGDIIRARRMREDFWEFTPTHKLVLLTNHKPIVKGQDHAIWRRLRLIPFVKQFWDEDKGETGPLELKADKSLPERLKGMRESILAWAVEGCLEWQREGLGMSQAMKEAYAAYKSESDVIGRFVEECCLIGEHNTVRASGINESLERYCSETGDRIPNTKDVSKWLRDHGYESKRRSDGMYYQGITLSYEAESMEGM